MVADPVKPQPEQKSANRPGQRWKYRQPTCSHGFVVGKGLCPHAGCRGAHRKLLLPHYRQSYLASKDMTAGKREPGKYRCYMCGRLLPDGTVPELGPSQFFRASSKRNGHQSRCKQCDNKRRFWRRWYGTAESPRRGGADSGQA
jgi:DNA-directed RNA polymerase subunit RPC12/RpoP